MYRTEEEATNAIAKCKSFEELEEVIKKYSPFISSSVNPPVMWDKVRLIRRINRIREGHDISLVTRANGIRFKVAELLLA